MSSNGSQQQQQVQQTQIPTIYQVISIFQSFRYNPSECDTKYVLKQDTITQKGMRIKQRRALEGRAAVATQYSRVEAELEELLSRLDKMKKLNMEAELAKTLKVILTKEEQKVKELKEAEEKVADERRVLSGRRERRIISAADIARGVAPMMVEPDLQGGSKI